jgi:hypothetical protein|tara:strand:+ start:188 stop:370 length:183 start_codon:yes stop_codon:yes gene_type:complete
MRQKNTCIKLIDNLDGKLKTLLFILSRPNANAEEFKKVIGEMGETSSNLRRFIERENETM